MAVDHKNRASETQQEYSNAIAYHDYWVKQCIERVQKILPADTVVLFTSDHGQLLGERGLFGHNQMQPEVADVPVWALTIGADTALIAPLKKQTIFSHYDLGKHVASLLGATVSNPNEDQTIQYVHGSEIYSAYEYMPWKKTSNNPQFLKNSWVGQVSYWTKSKQEFHAEDPASLLRNDGAKNSSLRTEFFKS